MSKSDLKLIVESLYNLGVIKKKKGKGKKKKPSKKTRVKRETSSPLKMKKRKNHKSVEQPTESKSPSITYGIPFQNSSTLQDEVTRTNLKQIENTIKAQEEARKLSPQILAIENQLNQNTMDLNRTQKGVVSLYNRALNYVTRFDEPTVEEVDDEGFSDAKTGFFVDDNIDVPTTSGSDGFTIQETHPQMSIQETQPPRPLSLWNSLLGGPSSEIKLQDAKQSGKQLFPQESDEEEEQLKTPAPKIKKSTIAEREKLKSDYIALGGDDNNILSSTHKKTVQDAIKNLQDLEFLKENYQFFGGDDSNLLDGDISVIGRLKNEVKRLRKLSKK